MILDPANYIRQERRAAIAAIHDLRNDIQAGRVTDANDALRTHWRMVQKCDAWLEWYSQSCVCSASSSTTSVSAG